MLLFFMLKDEDITSSSASAHPLSSAQKSKKTAENFSLTQNSIFISVWRWYKAKRNVNKEGDKWDSMPKEIMGNLHCNAMGAVDLLRVCAFNQIRIRYARGKRESRQGKTASGNRDVEEKYT